ncbi:unnamed protein product [Ectocarpus fasciculatus]
MRRDHNNITLLLEAGADLNSRRFDGATPLCLAAWKETVDAVRLLLLAKAAPLLADPESSKQTFLPSELAADTGHLEVVHELIRQVGIDGCGGSSGDVYALRRAAQSNYLDIESSDQRRSGRHGISPDQGRPIWRLGLLEVSVGAGKGEARPRVELRI